TRASGPSACAAPSTSAATRTAWSSASTACPCQPTSPSLRPPRSHRASAEPLPGRRPRHRAVAAARAILVTMSRKRVLLAHTGGTIGMRRGPGGYEPAPGHLERLLAAMPELSSPELPETELVEFEPLLDSSDMAPSDWQRVARIIESRYDRFDGFVVLHGTDTLAYTASALSFLLEGLGKPVVVTGSQVPLGEVRTDARENLVGSLLVAAGGQLP